MRLMESTIDDWSKETVAQAQKDLEEQKIAWELQQQQKNVQEHKLEIDDDSCTTEDYLSYTPSLNSLDQVKHCNTTTVLNGGFCSIATKS